MENQPDTLLGGPCDGLDLDIRKDIATVYPGPHHLRECGITDDFCDATPMYVRCPDGRFRYHRKAAGAESEGEA